jgi:hypothetical protein
MYLHLMKHQVHGLFPLEPHSYGVIVGVLEGQVQRLTLLRRLVVVVVVVVLFRMLS